MSNTVPGERDVPRNVFRPSAKTMLLQTPALQSDYQIMPNLIEPDCELPNIRCIEGLAKPNRTLTSISLCLQTLHHKPLRAHAE